MIYSMQARPVNWTTNTNPAVYGTQYQNPLAVEQGDVSGRDYPIGQVWHTKQKCMRVSDQWPGFHEWYFLGCGTVSYFGEETTSSFLAPAGIPLSPGYVIKRPDNWFADPNTIGVGGGDITLPKDVPVIISTDWWTTVHLNVLDGGFPYDEEHHNLRLTVTQQSNDAVVGQWEVYFRRRVSPGDLADDEGPLTWDAPSLMGSTWTTTMGFLGGFPVTPKPGAGLTDILLVTGGSAVAYLNEAVPYTFEIHEIVPHQYLCPVDMYVVRSPSPGANPYPATVGTLAQQAANYFNPQYGTAATLYGVGSDDAGFSVVYPNGKSRPQQLWVSAPLVTDSGAVFIRNPYLDEDLLPVSFTEFRYGAWAELTGDDVPQSGFQIRKNLP